MFILKSIEKVELKENFLVVNGKELNFGELTEDDKEVLSTMISKGAKYLPLLYLNNKYMLESVDGKRLNKIEYLSYLLECKRIKKVGVKESNTKLRPLANVENLEILEGDNNIYFGKEGRLYEEAKTFIPAEIDKYVESFNNKTGKHLTAEDFTWLYMAGHVDGMKVKGFKETQIFDTNTGEYLGEYKDYMKESLKEGRLWGEYEDEEDIKYEKKIAEEMKEYADDIISAFKNAGWEYDDSSAKYGHYKFSKDGVSAEYCDNFDKLGSADIESEVLKKLTGDERERYGFDSGNEGDNYANIDFRWFHPAPERVVKFVEYAVSKSLNESVDIDPYTYAQDVALKKEVKNDLDNLAIEYAKIFDEMSKYNSIAKSIYPGFDEDKAESKLSKADYAKYKDNLDKYNKLRKDLRKVYDKIKGLPDKSLTEDEEPENITYLLDRWDWKVSPITEERLGMDSSYHKLLKSIHDAEMFNYHSDYWGNAEDYQSDAIEVVSDFEPYIDKMVKINFDDGTSEVFKLLGVLIDKQYNSLSHMNLLVEEVDNLKEGAYPNFDLPEGYPQEVYDKYFEYTNSFDLVEEEPLDFNDWCKQNGYECTVTEEAGTQVGDIAPKEDYIEPMVRVDKKKKVVKEEEDPVLDHFADLYYQHETEDNYHEWSKEDIENWIKDEIELGNEDIKLDDETIDLLYKFQHELYKLDKEEAELDKLEESLEDPKVVQKKTAKLPDGTEVKFITYKNDNGTYNLQVMSGYENCDEYCGEFKELTDLNSYIEKLINSGAEDDEKLYYVNYIKESVNNKAEIEYVEPNYSGGGIYLYTGKLRDGNYFLGSDETFYEETPHFMLRVVDEDPNKYEEDCWFDDWQQEHLVKDLTEEENKEMTKQILHWVVDNKPDGNYQMADIKNMLDKIGPKNIEESSNEEIDGTKQRFIDYCKGKIESLGSVEINSEDVEGITYIPEDEEPKTFEIKVDYISRDDVKALNPIDTLEAFELENTYLYPDGRVFDGGEMDAGHIAHLAELDFKAIDKKFYQEVLDNWESWELPSWFEVADEHRK